MARDDLAPVGLTWRVYVGRLVERAGGWTALAEELARRADGKVEAPLDLASIEKGVRRLAQRDNEPGGQYGRWLVRLFGVPEDMTRWARWLAQYHSRFTDLPVGLRLEQLRLWDRPPFAASSGVAWTHVGLASALLRHGDAEQARDRLGRARATAERAGPAAVVEVALLDAYVMTNDGERGAARGRLDDAEGRLAAVDDADDRACLRARVAGQRAYHLTKPEPGGAVDLAGAAALFAGIDDAAPLPFVAFRRDNGLAYCAWKLGDAARGAELARRACEHAGDGGFVRFRVLALNLLARIVGGPEAIEIRARVERLARSIEDEELLARAARRAG